MHKGIALVLGVLLLAGCKPPRPAEVEPPPIRITIQPSAATLTTGHLQKFLATVSDGANEVPVWSVLEPAGGVVDNLGRYTAALVPGVYTLQAGLVSGRASARAVMTVVAPPDGTITAPARVTAGATGLRARVPAAAGSTYAWVVQGGRVLDGGNTPAITFEAGNDPKVLLQCKVTNVAGDSLTSGLELPLAAALTLAISPVEATLTTGRQMKFGYELVGGASGGVRWSAEGGAVDGTGRYTAPGEPGLYVVRVAAQDDPATGASARIRVVAAPAGVIVAPAKVLAGAKDLVASVVPQEGMTYAWELEGGTSSDGLHGPSLTFSAGAGPGLTLRCTIQNAAKDSLTLARTLVVAPNR